MTTGTGEHKVTGEHKDTGEPQDQGEEQQSGKWWPLVAVCVAVFFTASAASEAERSP